jgi:hypothetical protein
MTSRDLAWFPLDSSKADLHATEGAYVNGITLLKIAEDTYVVVGGCSCTTKQEAERLARSYRDGGRSRDLDRHVGRAKLLSWAAINPSPSA